MVEQKTELQAESKTEQTEEFDIKEIYTPLSVAKEEIWRRWNDPVLRKKVEDFLGGDMPKFFKKEPKANIFRYIATPNLEFELAMDSAKLLGLNMVFMEFLKDKFCTTNKDKVHLGKMYIYRKKNGEDGSIENCIKVIDLMGSERKSFNDIKTKWKENFVDFHHRIFFDLYKNTKTFDVSIFKKNGESAYEVYLKVFAFFVCNGVLFENYFVNTNRYEKQFTTDVIKPAFEKVSEIFGVKPLIIPLVGQKEDGDIFWQYYDTKLKINIK